MEAADMQKKKRPQLTLAEATAQQGVVWTEGTTMPMPTASLLQQQQGVRQGVLPINEERQLLRFCHRRRRNTRRSHRQNRCMLTSGPAGFRPGALA